MTKEKGMDISEHNGKVDFAKAKKSGIDFVMLRASWGNGHIDGKFRENVKKCNAAGMPWGAYHYSYALNRQQAREEASKFKEIVEAEKGRTYPLVVDIEDADHYKSKHGFGSVKNEIPLIMEFKKILGDKLMLYCNLSYYQTLKQDAEIKAMPLWLAQWGVKEPSVKCEMWQYSSGGKVPGVNGRVDMNIAYISESKQEVKPVEKKTKYKKSKYAKKIKKYLHELDMFDGKISSYVTPEYTEAVKKVQDKHFKRKADRDGVGGADTLKLVHTLYNFKDIKHFKPSEFRCNCGHCTGYPAVVNKQLLKNLDYLREHYGSITITSGVRCKWKNSRLVGSSSTSYHMKGKAADMYNPKLTATYEKRRAFIRKWYTFKGAHYAYGNTPNMGNAVHVDVK